MPKVYKLLTVLILTVFLSGCFIRPLQTTLCDLQAQTALDEALRHIDAPYLFGGRGPSQFDCSGLITYSYKKALGRNNIFWNGAKVADDATMVTLLRYNTEPTNEPKPGDIVFIENSTGQVVHGGMVIELINTRVKFINASSLYGKVTIDEWESQSTTRDQRVYGYGRLKVAIN